MDEELGRQRMPRDYDPTTEFIAVLMKPERSAVHRLHLWREEERDLEIRGAYVEADADERHARLSCTACNGHDFVLASQHTQLWPFRYTSGFG